MTPEGERGYQMRMGELNITHLQQVRIQSLRSYRRNEAKSIEGLLVNYSQRTECSYKEALHYLKKEYLGIEDLLEASYESAEAAVAAFRLDQINWKRVFNDPKHVSVFLGYLTDHLKTERKAMISGSQGSIGELNTGHILFKIPALWSYRTHQAVNIIGLLDYYAKWLGFSYLRSLY